MDLTEQREKEQLQKDLDNAMLMWSAEMDCRIALESEIQKLKKEYTREVIDTLRQWMSIGSNIENAASKLVSIFMSNYNWGEILEEDIKSKIEEFICTEMFVGTLGHKTNTDKTQG